jgi:hypothetical protein
MLGDVTAVGKFGMVRSLRLVISEASSFHVGLLRAVSSTVRNLELQWTNRKLDGAIEGPRNDLCQALAQCRALESLTIVQHMTTGCRGASNYIRLMNSVNGLQSLRRLEIRIVITPGFLKSRGYLSWPGVLLHFPSAVSKLTKATVLAWDLPDWVAVKPERLETMRLISYDRKQRRWDLLDSFPALASLEVTTASSYTGRHLRTSELLTFPWAKNLRELGLKGCLPNLDPSELRDLKVRIEKAGTAVHLFILRPPVEGFLTREQELEFLESCRPEFLFWKGVTSCRVSESFVWTRYSELDSEAE